MLKKRIGLIIPNLQSGGAERVISLISRLLVQDESEVYIFLFDTQNISYPYEGKLVDLKSKAGKSNASKFIKRIFRILKLSYYKNKYDLDTVISFLYSANAVNYYSFGHTKKILACRGYSDYIANGRKYSKMLKNIDGLIVQTERMKMDFISDHHVDGSKITVMHNPFNIKFIKERASEDIAVDIKNFIKTHLTICTVGTFKKDKGYYHLLKAFNIVKREIPDAGLIVIGHRGEMENEIKEFAKSLGYSEDILFLGFQDNPFKFISKCHLYVCSSIHEGFPNALVEAMACGVPVVSTDCKVGPREIVLDNSNEINDLDDILFAQYGILVPAFKDSTDSTDINDTKREHILLARAIESILTDKILASKYSEYSLIRAMQYDISTFSKKIYKLYS